MTERPTEPEDAEGARTDTGPRDRAMAVAFGALPSSGNSILVSLAAQGSPPARVALRSPPGEDDAPPLTRTRSDDPAARTEGRYQILGEIARGGVGVVLRGHDVDLGRDVAIKVLREDHGHAPEMLQRFVEEAQVGGQLQHPGIVPVYEMGLRDDRRPYFSMKLVKGRTLSAVLAERGSPRDDRRRLLGVFESICQTMAYAHSRGVVHRDLKPSNVMVGSFGEVLVVDWGLAKVLRSGGVADERRARQESAPSTVVQTVRTKDDGSGSIVGSVMGTPAYMPPEQALGSVEAVDERSDVFSLGAILCEILTGRPPYVGDAPDVLRMAMAADLAGAHGRLEAAEADPALVTLAKECLAPSRSARPRDASAVAAAVSRHLADLEERARQAEVETAEARARAESERVQAEQARRAKRLGVALASAVAAIVVIAAGGWWWVESGRRDREAEVARSVDAALAEAAARRGAALAAGADGLGRWEEALASASRAVEIARAAGADVPTRERAADALAGIASEHAAARRSAEARSADERLLARLEEARSPRHDDDSGAAAEAAFAEAFREYGLAVDDAEPEAVAVVARARATTTTSVARALDFWSSLRRRHRPWDPAQGERLARVARLVDTDPIRGRIRDVLAAGDRQALQALAKETDIAALPEDTQTLLGDALQDLGDVEGAVAAYRIARGASPGSYWMNFILGYLLVDLHPAPYEEAIRYFVAASALRPRHAEPHHFLGIALQGKGDLDGAIGAWREGLQLQPDRIHLMGHVAEALLRQGKAEEALDVAREAIRRAPADAYGHWMMADLLADHDPAASLAALRDAARVEPRREHVHSRVALALLRQGNAGRAVEAAREEVRLRPHSAQARSVLGQALFAAGDLESADRECREAIRLRPDLPGAHQALGLVLAARGARSTAVLELREAVRLAPHAVDPWVALAATLTEVDPGQAVEAARKAVEVAPQDAPAHVALADALAALGDRAAAESAMAEAVRLEPEVPAWRSRIARLRWARGDATGAVEAVREAMRLAPTEPRFPAELATYLEARGDPAEARAALADAVRLGPRNLDVRVAYADALARAGDEAGFRREFEVALGLSEDRAVARVHLATLRHDRGDVPGAEAILEEGLRESPGHPAYLFDRYLLQIDKDWQAAAETARALVTARPDLAFAHQSLALALRNLGRFDEARAELDWVLTRHPDSVSANSHLGQLLEATGDADGALAAFRRGMDAERRGVPDPVQDLPPEVLAGKSLEGLFSAPEGIYIAAGRFLLSRGDVDEVVRMSSDCLARHPAGHGLFQGMLWFLRGVGEGGRHDPEAAVLSLQKAAQLMPWEPSVPASLGGALEAVGETERALDAFRRASRLQPANLGAHAFAAHLLLAREDYPGAIEEFRAAVRLSPANLDLRGFLADALMKAGDWAGALEVLRAAVEGATTPPEVVKIQGIIRDAERLRDLDARTDPRTAPAPEGMDVQEMLDLAVLSRAHGYHATHVRWLERAIAASPGGERRGSLLMYVEGARAAAHAAQGDGEDARDLPPEERARLRGVARRWLRATLDLWKTTAPSDPNLRNSLRLRREIERSRRSPVFFPFVLEEKLRDLSPPEQAEWRALWAEFDAYVASLRPPPLR